jgi:hypothetical protein
MIRLIRVLLIAVLVSGATTLLSARPAQAGCGDDLICWDGLPDGWYDGVEAQEIADKYRPIFDRAIQDFIDSIRIDRSASGGGPSVESDSVSPFGGGGFGMRDWD